MRRLYTMCGDVSLSLDLLKKRRYNKQTIKKFYPKERGPELKSRNQSVDMTQGVIWKQLAYFALPLFLGNLCQQLYNTADSVIPWENLWARTLWRRCPAAGTSSL